MRTKWLLVPLLVIFLASCGKVAATPTPVVPTDTPIPTQTEIPPTATVTSTPVPNGPCDNLLMSLELGNRWVYLVTSEGETSRHTLTVVALDESNGINMVIEMVDENSGKTSRDMVTCLNGGIEDFPIFFLSIMLTNYLDGVFNTYFEGGIYSPAYPEFAANNMVLDWDAQYLTEEDIRFYSPQGGSDLNVFRDSQFDLYFHTDNTYEAVTVPAGTFPQALVVTHEFVIPATTKLPGGGAVAGILTVRMTQWYEPFQGLVRAQVDSAGISFLPGQENVVLVDSIVELLEFTPGP
jgi:hypothetical protein